MDFNEKNTVKVEFSVMERLVRDSEKLATIKDYINNHLYLDRKDMQILAGLEVKEGEQ